jgi:amino-acid N-acetyltransferase
MDQLIQPIVFNTEVETLLKSYDLPTSDLPVSSGVLLFGHASGGALIGVIGLEVYGEYALLRSLAVADPAHGMGLGAALVAYAERYAAEHGGKTVYLLTTTAEAYFERRGYSRIRRSEAPEKIASTDQFSVLCPSSSTFMSKSCARESDVPDGRAPGGRSCQGN